MSFLRKLFTSYYASLHAHPIAFQAVQASILMGTGDVVAQKIREGTPKLDYRRTLKFACIGFFFVGPVVQLWYTQLSKVTGKNPTVTTLKKIALDQTLAAPTLLYCVLCIVNLTDGHSMKDTIEHVNQKYLSILLNNYKVWPTVQFVNFYFVPLNFQVPFSQIFGIFWDSYISYKSHHIFDDDADAKKHAKTNKKKT